MIFNQEVNIIKFAFWKSHSVSSLENGLEGYKPVRKAITSVILEKDASG